MQDLTSIFDQLFKFKLSQELRHKGDSKGHSADCGLLVLSRVITQAIQSGENELIYERVYHCRSIQFSGSNQVLAFGEHELLSIDEYEEKKIRDDIRRDEMKSDIKRAKKEVLDYFGVTEDDYLYVKREGVIDKTKKFRVTGFSTGGGFTDLNDKRPTLFLTESILTAANDPENKKINRDRFDLRDKNDFEKVTDKIAE